jgi:pimeloyl-ACP methyl ester carboxylesterase
MRAPALVLLPGLDGSGSLFVQFQAALPPHIESTVVRYPPDPPAGYVALEAIVKAHLRSPEPYVLVAESFSGPIALSIAAAAPPGLAGLVLSCSFARDPRPFLTTLASRYARRLPMPIADRLLLGRFASAPLRAAVAKLLQTLDADLVRVRLAAVRDADVTAVLPRIRVPVLYLQAAHDRIVPRKAADILAHGLPALVIRRVPGPHFLLQAAPAACAREVAHFLGVTISQAGPGRTNPVVH